MDNMLVLQWIYLHDIVFLSEIKYNRKFNVPGYKTVLGSHTYGTHGGVAILFRNHIFESVCMVDISCEEQIWFKLSFLPNVLFGGCYVVPSDSIYFSPHYHANIQSMCFSHQGDCVIFGDVNARCGQDVKNLTNSPDFTYSPVDNVSRPNSNGQALLQICKDSDLLIVNNLKTPNVTLNGALTFRKRTTWISEIDLVIVSKKFIHNITSLSVDQNLFYPSDHAPISFKIEVNSRSNICMNSLYTRAKDLGQHAVCLSKSRSLSRKNIPIGQICNQLFIQQLENIEIFEIRQDSDPEVVSSFFVNSLYQCAVQSRERNHSQDRMERNHIPDHMERNHIDGADHPERNRITVCNQDKSRWEKILEINDSKKLWHAINWKGQIGSDTHEEKPSDEAFQDHLEHLLNPEQDMQGIAFDEISQAPFVPVLDSPISIIELLFVIMIQLKPNKSSGPDGVSPGLFRFLPMSWMAFLLAIVNLIFRSTYPFSWSVSRLSMLFKKGSTLDVNNYRGISIINSITKIYDYILNNRLNLWFKPDREQAGAQPKRGCIEQIVALRLLFNYSFKKRKKLFVGFVDFSKAYDRVPRGSLFKILYKLGCGAAMLYAIIAMYCVTRSILGCVIISATMGVRQGSPTSCFLFTIFVNVLIRKFKEQCCHDGFLQWLHCLMLMDDTVILATSRAMFKKKLKILEKYCEEYGMVINADKTKFMVIHGDDSDKIPFSIGEVIMLHCTKYIYLGATFTADGSLLSSIREHVKDKQKHLNKLIIFFYKNQDMPFFVKKRVLDAAFTSALLYSCESWINVSLASVEKMYLSAIKSLLGVRKTTPNNLCLIELGYPPIIDYVKSRQKQFLSNVLEERKDMLDDPLMMVLKLTESSNKHSWDYIINVLNDEHEISGTDRLKQSIRLSSKTKMKTYLKLNPNLSVHPVYQLSNATIPDYLRTEFSRFRLSSHRLKIETGRWARLPPEERLCLCGKVQDEEHVLLECVLTEHIRDLSPISIFPTIDTMLNSWISLSDFKFLHAILRYYK